MTIFLLVLAGALTVVVAYLIRELQNAAAALAACNRERIRERTESERNRYQLARSLSETAAALRDLAHGFRIRRLVRPSVLTTPQK